MARHPASRYGFNSEIHRVRQPLLLADVLEQARAHAAAEHRIQDVADEALVVRQRIRRARPCTTCTCSSEFLLRRDHARVRSERRRGSGAGRLAGRTRNAPAPGSTIRSCVRLPAAVISDIRRDVYARDSNRSIMSRSKRLMVSLVPRIGLPSG